MINRLSFAALLIILGGASAIANAARADDGIYIEFSPGVSILADSDISGEGLSGDAEFDTGFVVGGSIGYRFLDKFRAEVNLSYREAGVDKITAAGTTLDGGGDASAFAAMANGYFDLDLGLPIRPYIGAGIGVARIDADSDSDCLLCVDDDATEFAWNVMVGASYRVFENIDLSTGYRYLGTTDPELDASIPGVGSGPLDAEIELHEVIFALRYNF